jgi:predicted glycoside hydrolase/deacetylase ChbG (UPF0249 family)
VKLVAAMGAGTMPIESHSNPVCFRKITTVADDFGLTENINNGIIYSFTNGILNSTAVLMGGMATDHAFKLAEKNPGLEIGLHLAIVESKSLTGKRSTCTDPKDYFPDHVCLHRHWKTFIPRWVSGIIDPKDLESELERQFEAFTSKFGPPPFVNGTQHLHVLPGISEMVIRLARKYGAKVLRAPADTTAGSPAGRVLNFLSRRFARIARNEGFIVPDHFFGFSVSGTLRQKDLSSFMAGAEVGGVTEIMVHPGRDCPVMKGLLPRSYGYFKWEQEMAALTSRETKDVANAGDVILASFSRHYGF